MPPAARTAAGLLCAAALGACEATPPTSPRSDDAVRVRATADSVYIENQGPDPVFTATFDAEALALILWWPCTDAVACPPIAAGRTRAEARPTWEGRPARQVVVYWWRAGGRDGSGAVQPDSIRTVPVTFP